VSALVRNEPMSIVRIPMTRGGAMTLKNELKRLKSVERPLVIEALEVARSHGDLSENADYDAAKDRQAFIEGRIKELEDKLARAEIVDLSKVSGEKIVFGATVTLQDEDGVKLVYQIVGDDEADIKRQKISISSPIARALVGREVGDMATVRGPKGGEREYEILRIEYKDEAVEEE
jgi:transcription elongation factor GreA